VKDIVTVESYPTFVKLAGEIAREFLLNMSKVYQQVTENIFNIKPPIFEYEKFLDGRLLINYRSELKTVCCTARTYPELGSLFQRGTPGKGEKLRELMKISNALWR